jgi:hypothetical protein
MERTVMPTLSRFILLAWLAALGTALAQVEIVVETDRQSYLVFEPVKLKITLTNNSGSNLSLQEWDDGCLNCVIVDEQDRRVRPVESRLERRKTTVIRKDNQLPEELAQERVNFGRGLTLATGAKMESTVAVNSYYDLARPGNYKIQVVFNHRRFTENYLSAPVRVDVKEGTTVVTKRVGVPASQGETIQARTCSLVDFRAETKALYCLKIEDDRAIHALQRLSPHAAGDRPEMEVDGRSQIHILIHTDPKVFTYWVYDVDGQLKQAANYEVIGHNQPHLTRDPDIGRVMVTGGRFVRPGADTEMQLPSYKAQ